MKVLGHVYTTIPEHLNEDGGEFTQAVTFKFNDSYNQVLYPRFVTVDEQGNINWNPKRDRFSDGTYEFYMFDTSAWGTELQIKCVDWKIKRIKKHIFSKNKS